MNPLGWLRSRERRRVWERQWGRADFAPAWRVEGPPGPLREAVADSWIQPGMRVLDIGCGSGEAAVWLAEQGCDVVGVDFAQSAIAAARRAAPAGDGLSFRVVDVATPDWRRRLGQFDGLLDRGCLHGLDPAMHRGWANNLLRWSWAGSRLLVMMHYRESTLEERASLLESLLGPHFVLESVRAISMEGPDAPSPISGGAFRLVRKS